MCILKKNTTLKKNARNYVKKKKRLYITLDHSLAFCVVVVIFFSMHQRAPMKAPILTPPTMSMGIPASMMALSMPTWAAPLAPPPPSTRPTEVPVSHRANLLKSLCTFGSDMRTLEYNSFYKKKRKI